MYATDLTWSYQTQWIVNRRALIANYTSYIQDSTRPPNSQIEDDLMDIYMKRVTVNVGNELLQRNILLLPTVQDMFNNCLSKMAQNHNLTVNRTVSSNWILSNLTVAQGKHINYCCTTRKLHVKKSKITCTPHPTIDRSSQLVDVIIEEEYVDQYGEIEDIMDFVFRENSQASKRD